jgi:hypothetical protein
MMKRKLILILSILLVSIYSFGQSYNDLVKQALSSYYAKDYQKSLDLYQAAFKIEQNNPSDFYNAACSAALSGNTETAFNLLHLSIQKGLPGINHLKEDADLISLHKYKKWEVIVKSLQEKVDKIEANYDKPLQKELLQIFKDDQDIRRQYIDSSKKYGYNNPIVDSLAQIMIFNDSIDLEKVTKILDTKGWVGKDKVGGQANSTLFLVIQHADIKTQQKYLPMMREAVKKGNASSSSLALLEDRVALREGKKQIYGSQIGRNAKTTKFYVEPLEDPDNVDKRRSEVGLGSLSDYVKNWDINWNVEEYKKNLPEIEKWDKGEY